MTTNTIIKKSLGSKAVFKLRTSQRSQTTVSHSVSAISQYVFGGQIRHMNWSIGLLVQYYNTKTNNVKNEFIGGCVTLHMTGTSPNKASKLSNTHTPSWFITSISR